MNVKQENKIACDWLLNYHQKLEAYQEMISSFSTLAATVNDGLPHSSTVGNPCMNKAISLTDIENYKNWLMVIETVEGMLNEKSREFLRLWRNAEHRERREVGRPGWYNEVSNGYAEFFQKRYGKYFLPSKDQLKKWRNDLVNVTARLAIRKNLL